MKNKTHAVHQNVLKRNVSIEKTRFKKAKINEKISFTKYTKYIYEPNTL